MNYRLVKLMAETSYSADTTQIIDLDLADPVSALMIDHHVLSGSDASMTAHPLACITKVELVDGSDVLYSLNGRQAQAIDWYENFSSRSPWLPVLNGSYCQSRFGMNFGRRLWDNELGLDPARFRNLQLKISLDIDAGGMTPTTNKLAVYAYCFDMKSAAFKGFLMNKEAKNYNMSASGHEYTDLPLDYPYRKLYIRQQTAGYEPVQILAHIKLSEDQDKKIPYDLEAEELVALLNYRTLDYVEHWYFPVTNSVRYLMCTPTTRVFATGSPWTEAVSIQNLSFYDGDGGRLKCYSESVAVNAQIIVKGVLPHGVFELPVGNPDDLNDLYEVSGMRNLKLDLTASAGIATSTCQIITQQVRKY